MMFIKGAIYVRRMMAFLSLYPTDDSSLLAKIIYGVRR